MNAPHPDNDDSTKMLSIDELKEVMCDRFKDALRGVNLQPVILEWGTVSTKNGLVVTSDQCYKRIMDHWAACVANEKEQAARDAARYASEEAEKMKRRTERLAFE